MLCRVYCSQGTEGLTLFVGCCPCDDEDEEPEHIPVHLALGVVPPSVLHQPHHHTAEHSGNHLMDRLISSRD